MDLEILHEQIDADTHLIAVVGEADRHTAPAFKERMAAAIHGDGFRVVVDLSKATRVDSTALGVIVGGERQLSEAGGLLIVVCPDPAIRKSFEATGLGGVLAVRDSREEALEVQPTGTGE